MKSIGVTVPRRNTAEMPHDDIPPRRRPHLAHLLPAGTVILWWQYYFPKHGDVWASARRTDHPGMQLLYSLGFWAAVAFLLLIVIVSRSPNH
jgi:hypothetical protein